MFAEFDFDNFLLGFAFAYALAMLILPRKLFDGPMPTQKAWMFWFVGLIVLGLYGAVDQFSEQDGVSALTGLLLATGMLVLLLRTKRWFPY